MANLKFGPGDYVKLRLALEEIEGRVLESPDNGVILLKLNSGYNIGISKDNILGARVIRKFKEEKEKFELPLTKSLPSPKNMKFSGLESSTKRKDELPSIGMVVTGGTIASKVDAKTGGVKPVVDIGEFAKFYPEMFKIVNVKKIDEPFMLDSSQMNYEHWFKIAESVKKMLDDNEISGVIVTHGTDTLHYTAAALSFFLRNLNKPVVLTFSQRSGDRASSDANLNLHCAARVAISDLAEVVLVGHGSTNDDFCYAMRGTKVRKMHSSRRDAFKPININLIAKVWPDRVEFISQHRARNKEKVELDLNYTDKVALVKFYPGQDPSILDFYALKYKGIVIEGVGLGHVGTSGVHHNWIPKLKKHVRNGFVVCMISQTIFGKVDEYVYHVGRELRDAGVIFLDDMLSETAWIKLGWVLGHYGWKKNIKEKMLENFAGEINGRLGIE
ncbi:Glu-tRNA(Gln) amidotransferase subunit GatD [Candidatus Pacearchaeota archaeon]|nr:Glu-tRNA(Gln) amidotransferase subunit GatD [Candidatus Pacearchaeota archaeon]